MNFCPYVCDRQKYIYLFGNLKLSPTRLLKIEAVLAMPVSGVVAPGFSCSEEQAKSCVGEKPGEK